MSGRAGGHGRGGGRRGDLALGALERPDFLLEVRQIQAEVLERRAETFDVTEEGPRAPAGAKGEEEADGSGEE
jgi:hypothetical protein